MRACLIFIREDLLNVHRLDVNVMTNLLQCGVLVVQALKLKYEIFQPRLNIFVKTCGNIRNKFR
jgi:hypothetical protein